MTMSRPIIFLGDIADAIGGPIAYVHVTADSYVWVDYFSGKCPRCNKVGPLHMHMQLLMATSELIFVLGCAPNATWWAHYICICSCRWLRLGRLFFRRCYWCNRVGPSYKHMRLPIATSGWIIFWEVPSMQQGGPIGYTVHMWLPIATPGPINVFGSVANAIGWAHHTCICSCWWLRLGRLFF